jgi:selenophosphate synthetase-related protein
MAGVVGTMLMLLECSGIGASIDVDAIPLPPGVPLARWLATFPSYGFILSVDDDRLEAVVQRFRARGLACAAVGRTSAARSVHLTRGSDSALLWDFNREELTGCGPATPSNPHQENPYA